MEIIEGTSTVLNGKAYCQGAISNPKSEYIVYCWDLSQNTWTALPPLHFRDFSLSQVNNELVAVGGMKELSDGVFIISNFIFTYDQTSQKWIRNIPSMPTPRYSSAVLSFPSALLVAGGCTAESSDSRTDIVEVFQPEFSMWYRTKPLLVKCSSMSIVATDDVCYILGGLEGSSILNYVFYASVTDLLHNAVPANETSSMINNFTQTVWKTLPNTPIYLCGQVVATLANKLITIGGEITNDGEENSHMIYMYSSSTNEWVHISDLPTPRSRATVVVLSSGEILMIGGFGDDNLCAAYKGKLTLQL